MCLELDGCEPGVGPQREQRVLFSSEASLRSLARVLTPGTDPSLPSFLKYVFLVRCGSAHL